MDEDLLNNLLGLSGHCCVGNDHANVHMATVTWQGRQQCWVESNKHARRAEVARRGTSVASGETLDFHSESSLNENVHTCDRVFERELNTPTSDSEAPRHFLFRKIVQL